MAETKLHSGLLNPVCEGCRVMDERTGHSGSCYSFNKCIEHLLRARHYFRFWGFRDGDRGRGRDKNSLSLCSFHSQNLSTLCHHRGKTPNGLRRSVWVSYRKESPHPFHVPVLSTARGVIYCNDRGGNLRGALPCLCTSTARSVRRRAPLLPGIISARFSTQSTFLRTAGGQRSQTRCSAIL